MSMKVTKVDGSVDEKNGLKYTVGDKSLGLLSTTIDKALGGMLKGEEVQLKYSPEYAKEPPSISLRCRWPRNINRRRFRTRLPQRKQSQRMSLQRVSQPNRYRQKKWWSRRPQRRRWLSRSLLLQMLQSRRSLRGRIPQSRRSPRSRCLVEEFPS